MTCQKAAVYGQEVNDEAELGKVKLAATVVAANWACVKAADPEAVVLWNDKGYQLPWQVLRRALKKWVAQQNHTIAMAETADDAHTSVMQTLQLDTSKSTWELALGRSDTTMAITQIVNNDNPGSDEQIEQLVLKINDACDVEGAL